MTDVHVLNGYRTHDAMADDKKSRRTHAAMADDKKSREIWIIVNGHTNTAKRHTMNLSRSKNYFKQQKTKVVESHVVKRHTTRDTQKPYLTVCVYLFLYC